MQHTLKTHWPGLVILFISILVGIDVYQNYGISYDELTQRLIGETFFKYAVGNYPDFQNFAEKDHGSGFELLLIGIERLFKLTEQREIFLMRHLSSYIFFSLSMFCGYVLTYKLFQNRWLATLTFIMLMFHPRLFAHSFFNSKDIPATCLMVISLTATWWAYSKQKLIPFFVLGIICGYGASIRITNIVVLAPLGLFFLNDLIRNIKQKQSATQVLLNYLALIIGFGVTLYISWPTLWGDPVGHFIEAYNSNANFRWVDHVRFNGTRILSTELPWYYIPLWMFITIPELWIILGGTGIVVSIVMFIKKPGEWISNVDKRIILMSLLCFFLPLVMVIAMQSVLYDGWRHMYFIYPSFIIIAVYTANFLLQTKLKALLTLACVIQVGIIAHFMVKHHPYQQTYFNHFISHEKNYIYNHYEMDYWVSSYKQALEWLYNNTEGGPYKINKNNWNLRANYFFVTDNVRNKFTESADLYDMDYYIEVYRTDPFDYPNDKMPNAKVIHDENVLNSPVFRITKLR